MTKNLRAAGAALAACMLLALAAAGPAESEPPPVFYHPDTTALTAEDSALAEEGDPGPEEDDPPRRVRKHPRFKSDIWLPLPSVILPGFGQYFQGDWTGGVYTGVAVVGTLIAFQGMLESTGEVLDDNPSTEFTTESWSYRKVILGSLAGQGSGFLSAYSAFRISVPRFQEEDGRYLFLQKKESVGDILISPLRFEHLLKPTTLIPLGILAGGVGWLVQYERSNHRGADWTASGDDVPFYGALGYNAGTTEEAVFRGWLLPVAHQYMGRHFWLANSAQALLFGAAHYSAENPVPWPQTLLGFYFGWLARRNQWTLSESIFLHTWWDMILFAGQIAVNREEPIGTARFRLDLPLGW